MKTYEELNSLIAQAERIRTRHIKDARNAPTLEQKILEQRRVKLDAGYIFWLKQNFYALNDGTVKLTDYKPKIET